MATGNGCWRPRPGIWSCGSPLRAGSFFPSLLERRRRVDQALFAVVMEAYLHGVSTRKVDDLVRASGVDSGISKSEVSRICADLDGEVAAFRDRSLAGQLFPYIFVDATYCKARVAASQSPQMFACAMRTPAHRRGRDDQPRSVRTRRHASTPQVK